MTWQDWMDLGRVYDAGAKRSREVGNGALAEVLEAMANQAERIGQARATAGKAVMLPCGECGGGYWQEYIGPPPHSAWVDHAEGCSADTARLPEHEHADGEVCDVNCPRWGAS